MSVARRPQPPEGGRSADGRGAPGHRGGGAAEAGPAARTRGPSPAERLAGVAPRIARARDFARRRLVVGLAKRLLPLAAVGLLALVALWPELSNQQEQGRYTYHVGAGSPEGGTLTDARYSGVDQNGRPFTITASLARQVGAGRTDLTDPRGDMTLGADGWMMVEAKRGVYMQAGNRLDLSGDVTLYRDDGTTLATDAVAIDLAAGAAFSSDRVHVQGPFGTLDAQGFTVLDRGTVLQFTGPGRLVLNGGGA